MIVSFFSAKTITITRKCKKLHFPRIYTREEDRTEKISTRFDGERCKFPVCGELHL